MLIFCTTNRPNKRSAFVQHARTNLWLREHPILKETFTHALTKGQYRFIDNVIEYAIDIQQEVISHIQAKLDNAIYSSTIKQIKRTC